MTAFDPLPVFCVRCKAVLKSMTPSGDDLISLSQCPACGIPLQDDDLFHHEGAAVLALRIHYYLGLGGDPTPKAFMAWRRTNE